MFKKSLKVISIMFDFLKKKVGNKKVAVFVDGPNIIRNEFDIDLDDLREGCESLGDIRIGKVFLNQFASGKLVEAVISQGFEPKVGVAGEDKEEKDVDVYMAVEVVEAIFNDNIDVIALATRDTDFLPVIQKAKEYNKETAIVCVDQGLSTALKNAVDTTVIIGENKHS